MAHPSKKKDAEEFQMNDEGYANINNLLHSAKFIANNVSKLRIISFVSANRMTH